MKYYIKFLWMAVFLGVFCIFGITKNNPNQTILFSDIILKMGFEDADFFTIYSFNHLLVPTAANISNILRNVYIQAFLQRKCVLFFQLLQQDTVFFERNRRAVFVWTSISDCHDSFRSFYY